MMLYHYIARWIWDGVHVNLSFKLRGMLGNHTSRTAAGTVGPHPILFGCEHSTTAMAPSCDEVQDALQRYT